MLWLHCIKKQRKTHAIFHVTNAGEKHFRATSSFIQPHSVFFLPPFSSSSTVFVEDTIKPCILIVPRLLNHRQQQQQQQNNSIDKSVSYDSSEIQINCLVDFVRFACWWLLMLWEMEIGRVKTFEVKM